VRATELFIISGVSGSGKSTALQALEDLGYFCIDNLPAPLLPELIRYLSGEISSEERSRFALLLDFQDRDSSKIVIEAKGSLEQIGVKVPLLFFDSSDEVLLKRFKEARRPHPLTLKPAGISSLPEAIREERDVLSELRESATYLVDTSNFSVHDLRNLITEYVGGRPELLVSVESFGFKYGAPTNADLVVDVRFLPNPHFVPALRPKSGLTDEVREYVLSAGDAPEFIRQYLSLLQFLLPRYKQEGKRYLTIAVGCTGGKHRSVVLSEALAKKLLELGERVTTRHHHISRD
jgi:UPF0042 nucleotide-binding protein